MCSIMSIGLGIVALSAGIAISAVVAVIICALWVH